MWWREDFLSTTNPLHAFSTSLMCLEGYYCQTIKRMRQFDAIEIVKAASNGAGHRK